MQMFEKPILGADFLRKFNLLMDMSRSQLIDTLTHLHIQGISTKAATPSPSLLPCSTTNKFKPLLAEYPTLTQPQPSSQPPKHNITHHITTTAPVSCRLAPKRLHAARCEFEHMLDLGIEQDHSP